MTEQTTKFVKLKDQLNHNYSLAVHGGALVVGILYAQSLLVFPPLGLTLALLVDTQPPPPIHNSYLNSEKRSRPLRSSTVLSEMPKNPTPLYP